MTARTEEEEAREIADKYVEYAERTFGDCRPFFESLIASALRREREDKDRLQARIEALEKGLEPFAKIAPSTAVAEDGSEKEPYQVFLACRDCFDFTGEDLARARALLAQPDTGGE